MTKKIHLKMIHIYQNFNNILILLKILHSLHIEQNGELSLALK